jgi:AcrR family transcriptional regulator
MTMPTARKTRPDDEPSGGAQAPARQRILDAAFVAFMESGFANASTLQIATRAQVSKRALYQLFGSKEQMLVACIGERARRLQVPSDLPALQDRDTLVRTLEAFGAQLLRETSDPTVIAVFRLAIAEAVTSPAVAEALDTIACEAGRAAVRQIMGRAHAAGLLAGEPNEMAERFAGLLWGNLMVSLLLRIVERPGPRQIDRRAKQAVAAFLKIYPVA